MLLFGLGIYVYCERKRITIRFAVTEMQLLSVEVDDMYVYGYHSTLRSLGCMLVLPSKKVE